MLTKENLKLAGHVGAQEEYLRVILILSEELKKGNSDYKVDVGRIYELLKKGNPNECGSQGFEAAYNKAVEQGLVNPEERLAIERSDI